MGRGDKKTKAGKIFKGSFGKFRSSKTRKSTAKKMKRKLNAFFFYRLM